MRNRLDDGPGLQLHGRTEYSRNAVARGDLVGRDVLDIGCGFGWFTLWALAQDARTVVGIEPQDEALVAVRRHIDDPRATFRVASATALPLDPESIDTIVMWEVLEHLPKQTEAAAFREISRVLRPGGVLYLSTPHDSRVARATDPAWWILGHRHYSRARIQELAEGTGLGVEAVELKGGLWEILLLNDLYVSKWILRRRPVFERSMVKRVDREWRRPGGFTDIFLRCRKPVHRINEPTG